MGQSRRHPNGPQRRHSPVARFSCHCDHAAGGKGKLPSIVTVFRERFAVGKSLPCNHHFTQRVAVQRVFSVCHGLILIRFDLQLKSGQTAGRHINGSVKAHCRDISRLPNHAQKTHDPCRPGYSPMGPQLPAHKTGFGPHRPTPAHRLTLRTVRIAVGVFCEAPEGRCPLASCIWLIFGVAMWALINLGIAMGVPAGSASLLIQFSAFFTLAWGCLLFRERLTGTQLVGIALAATGLVGILAVSPGKTTTTGLLLLLISALAGASATSSSSCQR